MRRSLPENHVYALYGHNNGRAYQFRLVVDKRITSENGLVYWGCVDHYHVTIQR